MDIDTRVSLWSQPVDNIGPGLTCFTEFTPLSEPDITSLHRDEGAEDAIDAQLLVSGVSAEELAG